MAQDCTYDCLALQLFPEGSRQDISAVCGRSAPELCEADAGLRSIGATQIAGSLSLGAELAANALAGEVGDWQ